LEYWNSGILGYGKMVKWIIGKTHNIHSIYSGGGNLIYEFLDYTISDINNGGVKT
jgi:hypothetical protein